MENMYGQYRGVVKAHGDNGKCRVYIPAVYPSEFENTPENLPWAEPAQPLFASGKSNVGAFQYPKLESTIWVFFEGGDINYPIMSHATLGGSSNFQTDKYIIKTDAFELVIDEAGGNTLTINAVKNTNITTPKLTVNGDVDIIGDVSVTGKTVVSDTITSLVDCISKGISFISHKHIGNLGRPTTTPF